jgi:hypothetical protein
MGVMPSWTRAFDSGEFGPSGAHLRQDQRDDGAYGWAELAEDAAGDHRKHDL